MHDAMSQLNQLNAMERQQDVTQWSSTALFIAANGVFLLALFSGLSGGLLEPFALYLGFGLLGLVICQVWLLVTVRAELYASEWLYRALRLQMDFGVPVNYSIWQNYRRSQSEKKPPISSGVGNLVLVIVFAMMWAISSVWGAWIAGNFLLELASVAIVAAVAIISVVDVLFRRIYLRGLRQRLGL